MKPDECEVEVWTDIPEYKGCYQVSSFGNIKSLDRTVKTKYGYRVKVGQKIKPIKSIWGYNIVGLWKNGSSKNKKVSRLVCAAFHENPENKPQVNHIDTDKTNDYYKNVEWSTNKENQVHAVDNKLRKSCIPVVVFNKQLKTKVGVFKSIKRASDYLGLSTNHVHQFLLAGKSTKKGIMFFKEADWEKYKTNNL